MPDASQHPADPEIAQYATTHKLDARKALYAYAEGPSLADLVREELRGFEGMSILDAGCGTGELADKALSGHDDVRLTLVDQSAGMVASASERLRRFHPRQVVGDMSAVPGTESFDRILIAHALHLVAEPAYALNKLLARLSGQRGRCVITMHGGTDFPRRRAWIDWFERTFNNRYRAKREAFNLDVFQDLANSLPGTVESRRIATSIRLTSPDPYLAYVETERHRWEREPNGAEWSAYLERIRTDILQDITRTGSFVESHDWGLATIQR